MKKIHLIFCFLFLINTIFAQSLPLSSVLPQNVIKELEKTGKIEKYSYKNKKYEIDLFPRNSLGIEAAQFWQGKRPVFIAESLYLIKKAVPTAAGADIPKISILMRNIESMQGVEYFNSDGEVKTLYHQIYPIKSKTDTTRIQADLSGSADGKHFFAFQEMATFGTGVYEYSFQQEFDSVASFSKNSETIIYSGFKLLNPEQLNVSLVITDLGDSLLVYSLAQADFFAVPFLDKKISSAFERRTQAVYNWFNQAFAKL